VDFSAFLSRLLAFIFRHFELKLDCYFCRQEVVFKRNRVFKLIFKLGYQIVREPFKETGLENGRRQLTTSMLHFAEARGDEIIAFEIQWQTRD
jgi:hypothetical protein